MITSVSNPTEFQNKLEKSLVNFLEENQQFNVQGSWTGEDGITVSVLVDFGIEDRDINDYYVGSVSARHEDNLQFLEDHEERELAETTTFREAESALRGAIRTVFDLPRYKKAMSPPEVSDIDTSTIATIDWTHFDISKEVDVPEEAEVKPSKELKMFTSGQHPDS